MKKYIYITFLLVMAAELYGQDYYPAHRSNLWVYNLSGSPSSRKVSVISDSLLPNGKHYSVMNPVDLIHGQYVRTDSEYVYFFYPNTNKEIPFFMLKGKVEDRREVSMRDFMNVTITKIDSTIMFNEKTHLISYLLGSMTITEVTLSDKFGITSVSFYDDPPAPWPSNVYTLAGCVIDGKTFGNVTSVLESGEIPDKIELYQNYPNPFNPSTTIIYSLPHSGFVSIRVYDLVGREIALLVNENKSAGNYSVHFDGSKLSSGVYYYRIQAGEFSTVKKMLLMK
ncbi:MAG: T9SS type A sorting domain-containing protein [Ignavibacteriales bacterium]|nr:T9SS type A sorting domain-containing protein [Ignavibacteriales bacterium]